MNSRRPPFRLALFTSLLASSAFADQFTLMDVTFTMTKADADATESHYFVRQDALLPGQPTNWTTPINYRGGQLHLRTEVIDKPVGGEVTQWSVCYIPHVGIGAGYGCSNTGTYTEEGVYPVDQNMTEWWQNDQIDWTAGIKEMHLVVKDSDGGGGHAHKRIDSEKFFPTTVRMTLVQVSNGSTYDETLVAELQPAGTGGAAATGGATATTATGGSETSSGGAAAPTGTGGEAASGGATGGTETPEGQTSGDDDGAKSGCAVHGAPRRTSLSGLWGVLGFVGVLLMRKRRRLERAFVFGRRAI